MELQHAAMERLAHGGSNGHVSFRKEKNECYASAMTAKCNGLRCGRGDGWL